MTLLEAIDARHSVRQYLDKEIEPDKVELLKAAAKDACEQSGVDIRLVLNEPLAFTGLFAHYGGFKNARNYFALSCSKDKAETLGYHGEKLVLYSQTLGLNTCWAAGSFKKAKVRSLLGFENELTVLIAVGYGENQGRAHRSKAMESRYTCDGVPPEWLLNGMRAAMAAPTAINQQRFAFTAKGRSVNARALPGPYSDIDLGIVKYHFELGAGKENFEWQ